MIADRQALPIVSAGYGSEIRRTLQSHGAVLVRGGAPREQVSDLRRSLLGELRRQGFATSDGNWTGMPATDVDDDAVNDAVAYDEFWASETMMQLFTEVLHDSDPWVFRNSLVRYVSKSTNGFLTGAHQDAWLVKPNLDFVGVWLPLHDVTVDLGGVEYALESHREGVIDHEPDPNLRNLRFGNNPQLAIPAERVHGSWAYTEALLGDVIFFTAVTVHRSLPNRTDRAIRCSIDTRIQPGASERGITATHSLAELRRGSDNSVNAGYRAAAMR